MTGFTLEELKKMGAEPIQRVGGFSLQDLQVRDTAQTTNSSDSSLSAGLKTLGNVPKSTFNFAKGVVKTLNPLTTVKTIGDVVQGIGAAKKEGVKTSDVIKGLPKAAYDVLVPQFFHALFSGDTETAQKIITEDPVGQIAPIILAGRGIAEKAGFGTQFDSVTSKIAKTATKPITTPLKAATKLATNALGVTTGAGGEAVRTAFQGGSDFTNAMRGNTSMQDVLQESTDAVSRLKEKRSQEYQTKLANIKSNTASLDISPILKTLNKNLEGFNVKPINGEIWPQSFSRSTLQNDTASQQIFKTVYDNLKTYGTEAGDRTPFALDTLKRSLGDLYSPNSSVRSFTQSMYDSVNTILKQKIPEYSEMTKGYQDYSNLIKDIKQNLSVGGKAGEEAAIKRLSGALKQNNELRLEVLKELEQTTGTNLRDKIAGAAMSDAIPRGLIGKGIDLYAISSIFRGILDPSVFAQILATSPRAVGEIMNALGIASRFAVKIVKPINESPMVIFKGKGSLLPLNQESKKKDNTQIAYASDLSIPQIGDNTPIPAPEKYGFALKDAYTRYPNIPKGSLETILMTESSMGQKDKNKNKDYGKYGYLTGITKNSTYEETLKNESKTNTPYAIFEKDSNGKYKISNIKDLGDEYAAIQATASIVQQKMNKAGIKKIITSEEFLNFYNKFYKTEKGAILTAKQKREIANYFISYASRYSPAIEGQQ